MEIFLEYLAQIENPQYRGRIKEILDWTLNAFPDLESRMEHFAEAIASAGYGQSKMLFRIRWEEPVNYSLLDEIIRFNRLDKAECKTFWRK